MSDANLLSPTSDQSAEQKNNETEKKVIFLKKEIV